MAHLSRQHGLMVEGFQEICVGMLALDGDAKQPGEAGKEVRIGNVELAGVRAIDFEDAERQMAFAASCAVSPSARASVRTATFRSSVSRDMGPSSRP
jgi:hypothetical protein